MTRGGKHHNAPFTCDDGSDNCSPCGIGRVDVCICCQLQCKGEGMIVGGGGCLEECGVHATLSVAGKRGGTGARGHPSTTTTEKSNETRWRCSKDVKGLRTGIKGGNVRLGRKEKVGNVSRAVLEKSISLPLRNASTGFRESWEWAMSRICMKGPLAWTIDDRLPEREHTRPGPNHQKGSDAP